MDIKIRVILSGESIFKIVQFDVRDRVTMPHLGVLMLSIRSEVGTIFALSWLITWYGHVLSEFKHTLRLYDFFLASHPMMPIYLAATVSKPHTTGLPVKEEIINNFILASMLFERVLSFDQIVLHREQEVKQTECDMAMLHHLLSRIPQDLPYELLISQSQDLFRCYPPALLAKRPALQSRKRFGAPTYRLNISHKDPAKSDRGIFRLQRVVSEP